MKRISPQGWHDVILAALLLIILLAIFFRPAVFACRALLPTDVIFQVDPLWQPLAPEGFMLPGNRLLSDQAYQFYPWKLYLMEALADGRIPLWNPYINSGQPFLANAQTAIFSPFTLFSLLFPLHVSFAVTTLLCLFVAGLSTFLLAREVGIRKYGALAAMITFTFSGPLIVWLGHPHTRAIVWLPTLLFFTERVFTRQSRLYVLAAGATVGAQFLSGHPETSFHMMLVWLAFCVYRVVMLHGWQPSRLAGPGIKIVIVAIIGLMVSAVQLLPFLEFIQRSATLSARATRPEPSLLFTLFLDWYRWPTAITALLPQFFGTPLNDSYWYPYSNYNENTLYAGILPLALAVVSIAGVFKGQRSPSKERDRPPTPFFFLVLAVLSLCIALHFPLFNLVNRLPLFDLVANERLRNVYVLAVAILAGFGLDQVIGAVPRLPEGEDKFALRALTITLVAIAVISLLAIITSYAGLIVLKDKIIELGRAQAEAVPGHPLYPYSLEHYYWKADAMYQKMLALFHLRHVVMYLPVVLGLFIFGLRRWLAKSGQHARTWAGSLLFLLFLDLFLVGASYNPTIEPEQVYPTPEAIRFLQRDTEIYRIAGLGLTLMPNSGMVYHLSDARGYDAVAPKRYMDLFDRVEGSVNIGLFWLLENTDSPLLDLLNVKYVVSAEPLDGKWDSVYDDTTNGGEVRVYRNPDVLPRAFVVHHVEVVNSAEQSLARLTDREFDYRTTVILEGEPVSGISLPDEPVPTPDEVRIVRYAPERTEVQTHTSADGFLILTDGYDPGWRAELDGQPVEIHVANHAFRAVALPAGEHQVTFIYNPPPFKIGLGISLFTWAGVVVAAIGLFLVDCRPALRTR
jgi:hypothetical protein